MPRPKGQVSTGPLELVGLLRHCEWIAREKLNLPDGISEREEGRKLAAYFGDNGKPWAGFKTRQRDWLGDADPKGDTLRRQLRAARKIREATPKAWDCLVHAWTTMCQPADIEAAAEQGLEPIELIATNMLLFVVHGVVDEREVETLFANLAALYHAPDHYMGAWLTVTQRVRERAGVQDLRDLPPLLRQSG